MRRWDLCILVVLLYTATVTPVEVGMLREGVAFSNPLFILNRVVDAFFVTDLGLNFNLMYYDALEQRYITRRKLIVKHYLRTTALVDVVSTVPFDLIATLTEHQPGTDQGVLHAVRLLRLLKLLRIARATRVLRRVQDQLDVHYGYVTLTKFVLGMFLLAHWLACLLLLVRNLEGGACDWVNGYYSGVLYGTRDPCEEMTPSMFSAYITALYWSAMTISTVGYGDVMPTTTGERIYMIIGLFVGASFFSYIVGSVCGVLAQLAERDTAFQQLISKLNAFIREAQLDADLATRLRAYFRYQQSTTDIGDWADLLEHMTPALRGAVAIQINSGWIADLDVFRGCPKTMLIRLSFSFTTQTYPPEEALARPGDVLTRLYVVRRGLVAVALPGRVGFRVRAEGACIGDHILWSARPVTFTAMTLTYVDASELDREKLEDIVDAFPQYHRALRRVVVRRVVVDTLHVFLQAVARVREKHAALVARRRTPTFTLLSVAACPPMASDATATPRISVGAAVFSMAEAADNENDNDNDEGEAAAPLRSRPLRPSGQAAPGAHRAARSTGEGRGAEPADARDAVAAASGSTDDSQEQEQERAGTASVSFAPGVGPGDSIGPAGDGGGSSTQEQMQRRRSSRVSLTDFLASPTQRGGLHPSRNGSHGHADASDLLDVLDSSGRILEDRLMGFSPEGIRAVVAHALPELFVAMSAAATRVQSAFRGHRTRGHMRGLHAQARHMHLPPKEVLRRVERNTLVSAEQAVIVHVVAREVVALLAPRLTRIEELLAGREPTAATPGLYRVRRKEDVDASDGGGRASAVGRRL